MIMKKIYVTLLCAFCAIYSYGQTWTLYTADVTPVEADPTWALSDENSNATVYTLETMGELNVIHGLGDDVDGSSKGSFKMGSSDDKTESLTVMFRTKAGATRNDGLEFEINTTTGRLKFYLEYDNQRLKFADDGGSSAYASDIVVEDWHTYRITMNGQAWTVYMDEDPTPIATGTSNQSVQSRVVKFGDGGSNDTDGYLDWIAWDTSGEYAPGTTLPSDVIIDGVSTSLNDKIQVVKEVIKTQYYSINGVMVSTSFDVLPKGIYIKQELYKDGTSKSTKVSKTSAW